MAEVKIYPISDGAVTNEPALGFLGQADRVRYTPIDEVTADDETTVLYTSASYSSPVKADFGMTQLTGYSGVISKITIKLRMRGGTTSSYAYFRPRINTNSPATYSNKNTTSYSDYTWEYTTNPTTGLAWTWANINSLVAGIDFYVGSTKTTSRCTQMNVTVTYTSGYSHEVNEISTPSEVNRVAIPSQINGV